MSLSKSFITLTILGLSLYAPVNGMEQESALTFKPFRDQDELLDEFPVTTNGAPLKEIVIDQPVINLATPKAFTEPKQLGVFSLAAGALGGYGIGGMVLGLDDTSVTAILLATGCFFGGVTATAGLIKFLHYVKSEHAKDLADREAFIPHAQQAIINHRALPYHMNIPDALLQKVYDYSKAGNTQTLCALMCSMNAQINLTAQNEETKFDAFAERADGIIVTLPHPGEWPLLEEELCLPITRGLVREVLSHAQSNTNMKNLLAQYPLAFINRYYHHNCPEDKKAYFAESMAVSAAEMHCNHILSLVHANTLAKIDKQKLLIDARNAYFTEFTHLEQPVNQQ